MICIVQYGHFSSSLVSSLEFEIMTNSDGSSSDASANQVLLLAGSLVPVTPLLGHVDFPRHAEAPYALLFTSV